MNLSFYRDKLGITQRKLSSDLNIPPATLNRYENNITEPSLDTLVKLADYFHITLDELVGRPTNLINRMILSERENSIIDKILAMNEKQQELTEFYIDTMMGSIRS